MNRDTGPSTASLPGSASRDCDSCREHEPQKPVRALLARLRRWLFSARVPSKTSLGGSRARPQLLVELLSHIDPGAEPWAYPVDMVRHCTHTARILVEANVASAGVSRHEAEMLLLRYSRGVLHGLYGFLGVVPDLERLPDRLRHAAAQASHIGQQQGAMIKDYWQARKGKELSS